MLIWTFEVTQRKLEDDTCIYAVHRDEGRVGDWEGGGGGGGGNAIWEANQIEAKIVYVLDLTRTVQGRRAR